MSNNLRISKNNFIDQTVRISFKFNGKKLFGYKGDTLASALLANNIHTAKSYDMAAASLVYYQLNCQQKKVLIRY